MRPPSNSSELTGAQCRQMEQRVLESLVYLRKLLSRIEQLHFPAGDDLRRTVSEAYDRVHGLRITLHYMACAQEKRERDAQGRRSWEGGTDDPYWQSRQKRKG